MRLDNLRREIAAVLPKFIRSPVGKTESYFRRLAYWRAVGRQLSGVGSDDAATLRQAIRSAPWQSLKQLGVWRDPMLGKDAVVDVRGVGRFQVRAGSDDLFHVLPAREPGILKAIQSLLEPGDVFVDAGANIGLYTVLASRLVGPEGKVVAFEMMPDTAEVLRTHLRMNGCSNVTVLQKAISDISGDTVTARVVEGKYGQASIGDAPSHVRAATRQVPVETMTLDEALAPYGRIKLMKMDIEGVEERAIRGGLRVLPSITHVIYEDWGGDHSTQAFWKDAGYTIDQLDQRNLLASRSGR